MKRQFFVAETKALLQNRATQNLLARHPVTPNIRPIPRPTNVLEGQRIHGGLTVQKVGNPICFQWFAIYGRELANFGLEQIPIEQNLPDLRRSQDTW